MKTVAVELFKLDQSVDYNRRYNRQSLEKQLEPGSAFMRRLCRGAVLGEFPDYSAKGNTFAWRTGVKPNLTVDEELAIRRYLTVDLCMVGFCVRSVRLDGDVLFGEIEAAGPYGQLFTQLLNDKLPLKFHMRAVSNYNPHVRAGSATNGDHILKPELYVEQIVTFDLARQQ